MTANWTGCGFMAQMSAPNAYFGKKLIMINGNCAVTDKLGSVRAVASSEGCTSWMAQPSYFPYGEEQTSTGNGIEKFATYFRDANGHDYARQRYYNSNTGRFWSPDPGGIKTADPRNPTSWNRYAYANGDPVNLYDPRGLEVCDPDDDDGTCGDNCDDDTDSCGDDGSDDGGGGDDSGCTWDPTTNTLSCPSPTVPTSPASLASTLPLPGLGTIGETIGAILCGASGVCEAGGVVLGVGGVLYGVWELANWGDSQARRLTTVQAKCSVHQNGTPNHASVGIVIGVGTGNDFSSAASAAYSDAQARVSAQYGVGFHAQHCNYTQN